MIALVHERGYAKPEYDARAVALGRGLDARRKQRWFWLSTQEQVALARLGKALMADQSEAGVRAMESGEAKRPTSPPRASIGRASSTTPRCRAASASMPQGQPPLYASLEVAGVPRTAPEPDPAS